MIRSTRLVRFAGIDVTIHWTFYLLLGWVLLAGLFGGGISAAVLHGLLLASSFLCVVLHEFGHAFAARAFGIPTHGITLYPIGGVAQLDRIPKNPIQELVIALAGPAVNVVLALAIYPLLAVVSAWPITGANVLASSLLERLFFVNIALVLFNLIPAFPMDGGRVFRALAAMFLPYISATRIAVRTGQIVALGLAALGIFYNPMLLFLAGFVAFAAETELYGVIAAHREAAPLSSSTYGNVINAVRVAPGKYSAHLRNRSSDHAARVTVVFSDSNWG